MKTQTKLTPQIAGMYLGCEVEIPGEWHQGTKNCIAKLVEIDQNGDAMVANDQGKTIGRNLKNIKLILRSIEDMTDEEYNGWELLEINEREKFNVENVILNEAKRTAWLVDKGFDLFELIESGCAIRKQR